MVARKFQVRHGDSTYQVDYDTDDGLEVFKFQLFSLTSIPPDQLKIIRGDVDREISEDSDLVDAPNELIKLVSVNVNGATDNADFLKSDEELARLLQAEEEALMLQQLPVTEQTELEPFEEKILPYTRQVLSYEDPVRQDAARKTVAVEELEEKALVSLAKEGNFRPSQVEQDHGFLLQLLFWFKQSFRWVDAPPCDNCSRDTVIQGMDAALSSETQYGASRVELYRCSSCLSITRFPRYNDPLKLVETRRGRCGEWANCFTLYCRAFGYESRLVVDFTDHVWTECFSHFLGRWMHLDPCEGVYDKPLLYEKGWKKKLNYVIAIANDGVYDVTKRYTNSWVEVLTRRYQITEPALSTVLGSITKECRRNFAKELLCKLEERDKKESEELERCLYSAHDNSVSLPGRQSGDKAWRISRSEIDSNDNSSLSSSSCPIRVCVDEHVTRIYGALSHTLSQFVENSLSKSRVVEILKMVERILVDLRNLPFKKRRITVNPFALLLLPYFQELLDVLLLKSEISDGRVDICLADDPVKTSLALPVVLDALKDMDCNILACENLEKASLSFPLTKLNRIHSGLVLASGEELPFGVASSAFDGLRSTKWEEPNGARGCWIMYKLPDNRVNELAAYDIMSANDAPERDPMDWIVEGSCDGGSTWHMLDKQTSRVFEDRFQRRSFKIRSQALLCNAFRIRFLMVKYVQSNSRFQVGSIDLYASNR